MNAVVTAGSSRRTVRALLGGATSEAEARAYLQSRLGVLLRYMFWAFIALLLFLQLLYRRYPEIEPRHDGWVVSIATAALMLAALLWRGLLARKPLALSALHAIDLTFTIGSGVVFALAAGIAYDRRPSAYTCLTYLCFTLLTRALIVPSTGRRTAVVSALAFLPMTVAALALAFETEQELAGPAYFAGYSVAVAVTVLLAASGSRIIYGLRRQVSAARQLGQYTLERKIGEGGLGAVYLAHHVMLRRPTAIKLLLPDRLGAENLARFEREVQHMSQLMHPNTVAVFDYGRSPDGVFYYAMEYLGGGIDLEQLVRAHGLQPAGRVVPILVQVCGALQEAHDNGIIHRDIKPANIMLCERGGMPDVAKVVDFGLVKEMTADTGASTQMIFGTPAYLAPEAINEPETVGPAADLYALGCVGYFLLTGRRVFEGKTSVDVCIQHVTQPPKPLSQVLGGDIAADLEAVVMKCLAKSPDDRFASAAALAETLLALAPTADWTEADAATWWRSFRPVTTADTETESTMSVTMTVDFVRREISPQ